MFARCVTSVSLRLIFIFFKREENQEKLGERKEVTLLFLVKAYC